MRQRALQTETRQAQYDIRSAFDMQMTKSATSQAPLDIVNQIDGSRPPLTFTFINESILGNGVEAMAAETMLGCGFEKRPTGADPDSLKLRCRPDMGLNRGCELTRVCDCLEFAAVDEQRLDDIRDRPKFEAGETAGLPKRFPYKGNGLLQTFYLESRHPIYECNPRCQCGPNCKTRLVQKGRKVPLQIFKTEKRGWGA